MITIGNLGPGNKEQISGNIPLSIGLIKLWNQLPAETLATFHCKSHIFRKRVRKVITSEVK
jgi:hypothetical protein